MTAFYYAIGGALVTIGAAIVSVLAYRAVMDAYDRRHEDVPVESDTPLPVYPPIGEVIEGEVMPRAELVPLSVVEPIRRLFAAPSADFWLTAYSPPARFVLPALIADDVLSSLPWQTLRSGELVTS